MYIDKDVLWLEISMDDSVGMKLIEGNQDLCHEMINRIEGHTTSWEPTLGDGKSDGGDVHVGHDVIGGLIIESGDER